MLAAVRTLPVDPAPVDLARLRNVGVFAHIDAGKTTLSERFLVATGRERRAGRVDDGTTVLDWMPEERERGITITAAATRVRWGEVEVNLIDTPGHVDFTFEVERCLRALDGAVLVVDAVAGVQAQTETIGRQLARAGVPVVAFVNKCDRPGADALAAAATLRSRLGLAALPIAYPWYDAEGALLGVLDVIGLAAARYGPDAVPVREALPEALRDEVLVLRAELAEALAARDERLFEVVAAGREPSAAELTRALRAATLAREAVPVVVGAALRGVGVYEALDALVAYLPEPREGSRPSAFTLVDGAATTLALPPPTHDAPLVAFVFKVQVSRHRDLAFVRVLAGTVRAGDPLWNPRIRQIERVHEVLRLHANTAEAVGFASAGDIVALAGLGSAATGDTLVAGAEGAPRFAGVLAPLAEEAPVLALAVEPHDGDEREPLRRALAQLVREDPSFHADEDPHSGQWTARGMGELHLEVTLGRLTREFGLAPRIGRPRVTFREALTRGAEGRGTVERAVHGQEAFAEVELSLAPAATTAVQFAADAAVPEARRAAIAAALVAEAASGPRFGLPLVGASVTVTAGRTRPGGDAEAAWTQAAVAALRDALRAADAAGGVAVHEPLVEVVVETPEAFSSSVIGDLQARRAALGAVESSPGLRRIHARGPLAGFFGYTTALRSLSQGRAVGTLAPAGSGPVPEGELRARGLGGW